MIKTTSLETSKKLKDAGFKQETDLYFVKGQMNYGYEGEWDIEKSDEYFLFDERMGYKPNASNFSIPWPDKLNNTDAEEWDKEFNKFENYKKKKAKEWVISAPTTDELLDELPDLTIRKIHDYYDIQYINFKSLGATQTGFRSESLPEALASMWLWLKEEGLIGRGK